MFTDITVLLDRSGSMASVLNDTIHGFNYFTNQQKKLKGKANLTLVQFDSVGIDTILDAVPIKHVPSLILIPRGNTPLLDAIGGTIERTKTRFLRKRGKQPDKVLFVIVTDGEENASRKFTKSDINKLIGEASKELDWQFIYLGANQDAIKEGSTMGINYSYNYNPYNTGLLWATLSDSVVTYRSNASNIINVSDKAIKDLNSYSSVTSY